MNIQRLNSFKKDFKKLSQDNKIRTIKQLRFLVDNPRHPSLQVKKMKGCDIWEARINKGHRITFQLHEDLCVLRRVGNHDILKKP